MNNIEIKDFLPKYPAIEKSEYASLNSYNTNFDDAIFHKKEFYENRLEPVEDFPAERGLLLKHQITISRYLSSHTPYDKLLLVHQMGCVDPDTPILLWDGTILKAKDIKVGDTLIGDDGFPRKVLSLVNGTDEMFEIKQNNGDTYIVNSEHILTLVQTDDILENNIIEIKVKDYVKLTDTDKALFFGYRCSGIQWDTKPVDLDPYVIGLSCLSLPAPPRREVATGVPLNIPKEYIVNDRKTRLNVLACLIDGYGYVYNDGTCIEISQRNKQSTIDICYLTRSLGFNCLIEDEKHQLTITGNNLEEIPTLRKSLKSTPVQNSQITVTSRGIGNYVGWEIDGNRRFLLGDFTVTHNTGKSCATIGAIEKIKDENSSINGAIIIAKGQALLDNFANELAFKCTSGQYIPDNFNQLTEGQKAQRLRKKREVFYEFKTIQKFSKEIKAKKDSELNFTK